MPQDLLGRARIDPELALRHPRGDIPVRVGLDVRVDAQRHIGVHAQPPGRLVDRRKLRCGLDVKAEDPGADASTATSSAEEVRYGTRDLEIVDVRVVAEEGLPANSVRCGEPCAIAMRVRANHDIEQVSYGFRLTTVEGTDIYGTSTGLMGETAPSMVAGEELEVRFAITTNLAPGRYFLTVAAARDHMLMYDRRTDVLVLDVLGPFRGYDSSLVDLRARVSMETVAPVLQRAEA